MVDVFQSLIDNPWMVLFIISMIPFIELRGAVIVGTAMNLPFLPMLITCLVGNIIPVPFIMLFGRKILEVLEATKLFGKVVRRWKAKLDSKSEKIRKYGPIALITFVGIPIPGTGAWGGAVVSVLLNIRISRAVPCIFVGLILAYCIMTFGSELVFGIFNMI